MFTLPPYPPKDYYIKDSTKSLLSSSQFTPDAECRVTQTNLGKYSCPIEYGDDEIPEESVTVKKMAPKILERAAMRARAEWVAAPGKDGFLLHEVYSKYSTPPINYDPRFRNMEKMFNRSYAYELDCVETRRAEKVAREVERDRRDFEGSYRKLVEKQQKKEQPVIKVQSIKLEPPFWWRPYEKHQQDEEEVPDFAFELDEKKGREHPRWMQVPNLMAYNQEDPCLRKKEMHMVGQSFKTEACRWYYGNYPPPNVPFRPKRFQ